jgi:hypothetical protein
MEAVAVMDRILVGEMEPVAEPESRQKGRSKAEKDGQIRTTLGRRFDIAGLPAPAPQVVLVVCEKSLSSILAMALSCVVRFYYHM